MLLGCIFPFPTNDCGFSISEMGGQNTWKLLSVKNGVNLERIYVSLLYMKDLKVFITLVYNKKALLCFTAFFMKVH